MQISIPQIIIGIVSFFVVTLGFRVFVPIIQPVLDLQWQNSSALWAIKIVIYLIMVFLVYFVTYGTITGKKPEILGGKNDN